MKRVRLSDTLSLDILSRLAKLSDAGGWLRSLPDPDLMLNYPDAWRLWTILDFLAFQGQQEISTSLEALRKIFGWTRKKMLKEIRVLEEKGYIQRESSPTGTIIRTYGIPQNISASEVVPTGNKGCSHREQGLFPQGTRVVPTGNNLPKKNSVVDRFSEALKIYINTTKIPLNREVVKKILDKYVEMRIQIAGAAVRNPEAFANHIALEAANGNFDVSLLRRAISRVLFPKGWYQAHGSVIYWNGEKGKEYSPFGEFRGVVSELPPDAISVSAPEWAGDAK